MGGSIGIFPFHCLLSFHACRFFIFTLCVGACVFVHKDVLRLCIVDYLFLRVSSAMQVK